MDKKSKIKAGLIFGMVMALFFILGNVMTHDNLTTKNLIMLIVTGLFGGVLAALLFGWLIGLLANSKLLTQGAKINTEAGETILFETGANHFKGAEAVGGKLYLTNKRLVFKSHKFNIQNHELSISLSAINKVDKRKTLGLINNSLSITTANSKTEKFVVQQPNEWVNYLSAKSSVI